MTGFLKRLFRIDIPSKNLKLMLSNKNGGMIRLANDESIGGNAGSYKKFPCVGTNFYFDKDTGEIIYFNNPQYLPESIINVYSHGVFRIVVLIGKNVPQNIKNIFAKILEVRYYGDASKEAKKNIEASINLYNEKCRIKGFDI